MKSGRNLLIAILFVLLYAIVGGTVFAQDFGFGFDDDTETSDSPSLLPVAVKIGGEIAVELAPFVHDFKKGDGAGAISYRDIFSGKLKLNAEGKNAEAVGIFNLNADAISELWDASPYLNEPNYTPLIIDEAFLRGWIGPVNIEAGLRKLTWGKADSLGPLDVTNPLDYTDLRNMTDIQAVKIARPMVHVSWNTNGFSKLSAVFIPNFAGHRFAQEGRWAPAQYSTAAETAFTGILDRAVEKFPAYASIISGMSSQISGDFPDFSPEFPSTSGLDYFQSGLRFTTTIGPADIGAQYFYGNLFRPDFTIAGVDDFLDDLMLGNFPPNLANPYTGNPDLLSPQIKYNRYHQIGLDYAQVLVGFNVRAEFAVHLTSDLKGDDGSVKNPFIGWSLGFDRDLFWDINANVQCNETIRLMNDKVGNNPVLDCEADTNLTATRVTMRLSKKFLRDELESQATVIWGIEDMDCYIIPALIWTIGDFSAELSGGIFIGNKSGELGQYGENSFVRVGLKYSF
jgi:hypothetical protein